jgi:hypothetical protein
MREKRTAGELTSKESVLDICSSSSSGRDDLLRNDQFRGICDRLILLDNVSGKWVINKSLQVKNEDRRKGLNVDLLGSVDIAVSRGRPDSWNDLRLIELFERVGDGPDSRRLDVELQWLVWLESDRVLLTGSMED